MRTTAAPSITALATTALATTALAATALIAGGVVLSSAESASASSRHRIVVTEKASMTNLDLGRKGLSRGDRLAYTSVIRNASGKRVGLGTGDCVLMSGKTEQDALYHCTGIYRMGRADLSVTGLVGGGTSAGKWTITGGTGKWAGARGDMPYTTLKADTYRLVFRFTA